jgi:pilus assembly protein FimV
MLRKLLLTLVFGLVIYTPLTHALGLGEIKLNSNLNEPLDAEITLLSVRGETAEQIIASLGSREDFERSSIERLYFLTRIRFETIEVNSNSIVVRLTTEDPVREPFLNFLVSLEWPNGKLLREYTLLLDPPIFDDAPVADVTPVQTPRRASQPAAAPVRQQPARQSARQQFDGEVYGPTNSSDTLWSIASKVRPDTSVSIHRAMVALYEENPEAFMSGNINRLKRGAELRVPDQSAFEQVSQREALQLIREHELAWKNGTDISSQIVDTSDYNDQPATARQSSNDGSGRLSLATEEQAISGSGGSNAAIAEEENLVLKQQNQELEEQRRADADRIEQLERLLELKNEQLATLQSDAEEELNSEFDSTDSMVVEAEDTTSSMPEPEQAQVTEPATQQAIPVTESMPEPEPSLMDQLLSGAYNLYLAILAVIILVVAFIVRARNKEEMSYQDAITQTAGTGTSSVATTGLDTDALPETADEVLADDSNLYDTAPIDDAEAADPVGEADIYMAYGKFDQAETLLLNAISEDEERAELHAKLLECYAEMDSKEKFESHLAQIESVLNTDYELAQMVRDVYTTAWPEGDYYVETDELPDAEEIVSEESDEPDTEEQSDSETNFSAFADGVSTEDDIEELPSTEDVFGEVEHTEDSTEADDLANEFADLNLDDELGLSDELDSDDISDEFEFDETVLDDDQEPDTDDQEEESIEMGEDDVDTQLDLASAYIEMGDFEGAREIIEDVLDSGTAEQKQKAQDLLDSIES